MHRGTKELILHHARETTNFFKVVKWRLSHGKVVRTIIVNDGLRWNQEASNAKAFEHVAHVVEQQFFV